LSAEVRKRGGTLRPTSYRDSDVHGMLGGHARVRAAAELYLAGQAHRFLFATGRTAKILADYGSSAPSEAAVYCATFLRLLKRPDIQRRFQQQELLAPVTLLEENSTNTMTNLAESLNIIRQQGWERVAFLTSDYHVPRTLALLTTLHGVFPVLSAENVL